MESMNQIGQRIRSRRTALKLRQHDLAQRVGCNGPYISDLERGLVRNPTMHTLARVADALNWTVAELLGEAGGEMTTSNGSRPGAV